MTDEKKNCVSCGQEIEHFGYPLCRDCRPYMYKKQNHPHQKLRRTKSWKENREKRIAEANHQCEICSKTKDSLVIHHLEGVSSRTYENIWSSVVAEKNKNLIENDVNWKNKWNELNSDGSIEKLGKKIQNDYFKNKGIKKKNTCPFCGRASISERKTKKPKYRCGRCGKEFAKPKFQIPSYNYLLPSQLERLIKKTIITTIENEIIENHFQELKKLYQEKVTSLIETYLSMENTIVLCPQCHLATESGRILCPSCKQHYIYPSYKSCMDCQNGEFLAKNGAFYIIDEIEEQKEDFDNIDFGDDDFEDDLDLEDDYEIVKKYQIKSIYDKKLVSIYRKSWRGKWDPKKKVWKFDEFAFKNIIKKILDYLSSTGEPYELNYAEDLLLDVKISLKKNPNYRQSIINEI